MRSQHFISWNEKKAPSNSMILIHSSLVEKLMKFCWAKIMKTDSLSKSMFIVLPGFVCSECPSRHTNVVYQNNRGSQFYTLSSSLHFALLCFFFFGKWRILSFLEKTNFPEIHLNSSTLSIIILFILHFFVDGTM